MKFFEGECLVTTNDKFRDWSTDFSSWTPIAPPRFIIIHQVAWPVHHSWWQLSVLTFRKLWPAQTYRYRRTAYTYTVIVSAIRKIHRTLPQ